MMTRNEFHFTGMVEKFDLMPDQRDPNYRLLVIGEGVRVTVLVAKDSNTIFTDPSPGDFIEIHGHIGICTWIDSQGRVRIYRGFVGTGLHRYSRNEIEDLRLEERYSLDFHNVPFVPGEMQQGQQ